MQSEESKPSHGNSTNLPQQDPVDLQLGVCAHVTYDEHLLERVRAQWQFGDWESLAKLDINILKDHPDCATLALFAGAGQLQTNNTRVAKQYLRLALDAGCSNKLVGQILVAGVHNCLGRVAALAGEIPQATQHLNYAIDIGTPGSEVRLITQARLGEQLSQLGLRSKSNKPDASGGLQVQDVLALSHMTFSRDDKIYASLAHYLVHIKLITELNHSIEIGFNANRTDHITIQNSQIRYQLDIDKPCYLVSNEDGEFNSPPRNAQIEFLPDTPYEFSGVIRHHSNTRPVFWVFEYDADKKIASKSCAIDDEKFSVRLRTQTDMQKVAFGIRFAGQGDIDLDQTFIRIKSGWQLAVEESLFEQQKLLNEKLAQFTKTLQTTQRNEIGNALRQMESLIRLQYYLGDNRILPDMHGWPISPDLGLLIINLVEDNEYDAVIEFGSGTSTLLLATALKKVTKKNDAHAVPFLSFEHMQDYHQKTSNYLHKAGVSDLVQLELAPLVSYAAPVGEIYQYYDCQMAIERLCSKLSFEASPKVLVLIDGPPAATGKHARFPALPILLKTMPGVAFDLLMDDYIREDEKEIIGKWSEMLELHKYLIQKIEYLHFEKQACLLLARPNNQ